VVGRHPDVDEHQIRRSGPHDLDESRRVAGLPDDFKTRALQQAAQALAQQDVVVRHRYTPPLRR
jgi:hypothetical protein